MIQYKKCTEVEIDLVYEAFQVGYADYMIKFDISKEDFIKRFLGLEGNRLEHSFIAMNDHEPIGIILGGVKKYEGIKTMRCGTLAIHPEFRGMGISHKLFELHKEEALLTRCQQLFLEVIVGNDRAIQFYKKLGYEKVYDLSYYDLKDASQLKMKSVEDIKIKQIQFNEFQQETKKWLYFHMNWQNDSDYMEKSVNNTYYSAYFNTEFAGCLCVNASGKISFLFVDKEFREKGIASLLIQTACEKLQLLDLSIGFPNNSLLEGFLKKLHFEKNALTQYEMYLVL
ncbi:GNAT family N-acetyltransferase [Sporosarcina limicola]|uniref:Ribosomal protein S18 acetylase RimI-like enzyme n=1 Tax=Sporosarcina limicola TaxID=34101 RepID=A0A927MKT9_9BACL|nr:GNAT family N-acetyltransferase [Sporosarcina limicola]MBE1556550.1 ribosomal protein S18 acetylase RimI-like enzyme [Sporosarcina limicola]